MVTIKIFKVQLNENKNMVKKVKVIDVRFAIFNKEL